MSTDNDYEIYNVGGVTKLSELEIDTSLNMGDNSISLGELTITKNGIVSTSSLQIQGDELKIKDTGGVFYIDGAPRISGNISYGTEEPYELIDIFDTSTKKLNPDVYDSGGGTGGITKASQMTGSFWDTTLSVPNGIDVFGTITMKKNSSSNEEYATLMYDKISIFSNGDSYAKLSVEDSYPKLLLLKHEEPKEYTTLGCGYMYMTNNNDGFEEIILGEDYNDGSIKFQRGADGFCIMQNNTSNHALIINPECLPVWSDLLTSDKKINTDLYDKGITKVSEMNNFEFWDSDLYVLNKRIGLYNGDELEEISPYNFIYISNDNGYDLKFENEISGLGPLIFNYQNMPFGSINLFGADKKLNTSIYNSGITKSSQMTGNFWDSDLNITSDGNEFIKLGFDDYGKGSIEVNNGDEKYTIITGYGSIILVNEDDNFTEIVFGKSTAENCFKLVNSFPEFNFVYHGSNLTIQGGLLPNKDLFGLDKKINRDLIP